MIEDWLLAVSNYGFPIAMCVYFMTINNKTIKKNTEAINSMKTLIIQLLGRPKTI